jgi:hypothetical protein
VECVESFPETPDITKRQYKDCLSLNLNKGCPPHFQKQCDDSVAEEDECFTTTPECKIFEESLEQLGQDEFINKAFGDLCMKTCKKKIFTSLFYKTMRWAVYESCLATANAPDVSLHLEQTTQKIKFEDCR